MIIKLCTIRFIYNSDKHRYGIKMVYFFIHYKKRRKSISYSIFSGTLLDENLPGYVNFAFLGGAKIFRLYLSD